MKFRFVPLLAAALSIGAAGLALAAETGAGKDATAAATSNAKAWENAMQALKAKGYSQGVLMPSAETPGSWFGSARDRSGKRVDVVVDDKGNVAEQ